MGLFSDKMDTERVLSTIETVISENSLVVADYIAGKQAALEFLVGKCMKVLKGAADPEELRARIRDKIGH